MSLGRFFTPCAVALLGLASLKAVSLVDTATGLGALEAPAYAAGDDSHAKPDAGDAGAGADEGHDAGHDAGHDDHAAAQPSAPADLPADLPAAQCGPQTFAQRSGLSLSEIEVLRSLSARRRALEERERALTTRTALLDTAEARIDAQLVAMKGVRDDIALLLGQMDEAEAAEIDRLVGMYEKMKAKDAAPILPRLDEDVRVKVAARMKPQALAGILAAMSEDQAADLTMLLARRHDEAQSLADAFADLSADMDREAASVDAASGAAGGVSGGAAIAPAP